MELLTLSSHLGITSTREEPIEAEGLLPFSGKSDKRPFKFNNKPCIFLTSRVHPGETAASYVLNGALNFLTGKNNSVNQNFQAKLLMDNFVFKIIPMLNPDGVYRGYYRLDPKSQNLNRHYTAPGPKLQPTVYAAKHALLHAKEHLDLKIYVDLHAHASKRGCFMFGNSLKGEDQL